MKSSKIKTPSKLPESKTESPKLTSKQLDKLEETLNQLQDEEILLEETIKKATSKLKLLKPKLYTARKKFSEAYNTQKDQIG